MKKICIIGLGWLGEKLGKHLQAKAYEISGTCTTEGKKARLEQQFKNVSLFSLDEGLSNFLASTAIQEANIVILTIPPSASSEYSNKMIELIDALKKWRAELTIIYTSSTSVYGSRTRLVHEKSETSPETDNAKAIIKIENHLLNNFTSNSYILRLGGLVGDQRHPAKFLAGRSNIKKGEAVVNLIHYHDILRLVEQLLESTPKLNLFNLVTPSHPKKKDYYSWAANILKLEEPQFEKATKQLDKTVISQSLKKLQFEFKYSTPYDYPEFIAK